MSVKLKRYENNPILSPNPKNSWESLVTTNPGAWYEERDGKIYMLYRAAGHDVEHIIRQGLAVSEDGFNFTRVSEEPVLGPSEDGWDAGCIEDARMVKIDDWYYVTYAARAFHCGQYWLSNDQFLVPKNIPPEAPWALRTDATVSGLAMTQDFKKWTRCGRITSPTVDDRDVMMFPEKIGDKFFLLHRPGRQMRNGHEKSLPSIHVASSDDLLDWRDSSVLASAVLPWEGNKVGASCPPIKTSAGWLLLYHAVTIEDQFYRLGAMLLDLDDPRIVTHRTLDFIMEPEHWYEIDGFYKGVCFPCGNIVKDGELFVYYGGADKYCAVATCNLNELLGYLLDNPWKQ